MRVDHPLPGPGIRRVSMIHLPLLTDAVTTTDKTAIPRLLALIEKPQSPLLPMLRRLEIILPLTHGLALRNVVVVVEVAVVARYPGESPAHALLVGVDLFDRRARDERERRAARVHVLQRRDRVARQRAGFAAGAPRRVEHEVVDEELLAVLEEIGQRAGDWFAGRLVDGREGVRLSHFDDWERLALSRDRVVGPGYFLLFLQQGEARGEVLVRGYDLSGC